MRKKILSWVLTVAMVLSIIVAVPITIYGAPVTVKIYVDSNNGDDTNDGSLGNPYSTIGHALSKAQTDYISEEVIIYLIKGDYTVTEYINHANLTIEAYSDGSGNYDTVTLYPDYGYSGSDPTGIYTEHWIFALNSLNSKAGLVLSHVNISGDDFQTVEVEDGSSATGVYVYSADGAGTYVTLDNCTINNIWSGIDQRYSDYITVSILDSVIESNRPIYMEYGAALIIEGSTISMPSTESSCCAVQLNGGIHVNIKNNKIYGNNGTGRGIYEDVTSGEISGNEFLDLDIALELSEISNLTISHNYVETTNNGFDLETHYYSPASMTITYNTIINKTLKNAYQTGIKLYLNDDTNGSVFNVYGNEIANFAYGLYYDGDDYYSDLISLNLSNEGAGNLFRGNILNMYIESLRSSSKVDVRGTDWGSTNNQEIYDRIYFRDIYPSADSESAAATHVEAFIFDDFFTTSAPELLYVDDDYSNLTEGFGKTHFTTITEAKSRARSGGTIHVAEGLYDEQVFLFQPVTIQGSGENTIIKNTSSSSTPIMLVAAPDTKISGMNFQGGSDGLLIADFDYCLGNLNNIFSFRYYDSKADNAIISNNIFGNQSYTSISINYQNYPSTLDGLTVEGNIFNSDTNNTYNALASRYDFSINSPTIKDNQILSGYMNGFRLRFEGDALLQGNEIIIDGDFLYPYENKVGFTLFVDGNAIIDHNSVHFAEGINYADSTNDSIGIRYEIDEKPTELSTAVFHNNALSGADYALHFYAYNIPLEESDVDVTVGGSDAHCNDLSNNTYGIVSQYKTATINASHNTWGVADEAIPDMILDDNDETYYGPVVYLSSADLAPNATLSDLSASSITLSPVFSSDTTSYSASVNNSINSTIITVEPANNLSTVTINGTAGTTKEVDLAFGSNTITIVVTAQDGITTETYTVIINRAGSSSSSSGGSNYTPPAIVVTTEETDDSTINKTEITATYTSQTGLASISEAVVNALLGKADTTGGIDKGDIIEVTVDTPDSIEKLKVSIPQIGLYRIASDTDSNFAITSPFISITFDRKALETVSDTDSGGMVVITASVIDNNTLSESDKTKVKERPVYDFTVMNGDTRVSHFGGGYATVKIPYKLQPGENPNAVVIYYLTDDGSLKTVRGHYDATVNAVLFKTTHFSKFIIGYNPVTFSDIATDSWYKSAVEFISARGITSGTGNNQFSPDAQLTRAQFVVLLMNAYQINTQNRGEFDHIQNFTDAGNTYYTEYLLAAKSLGLVNGVGNNLFAPEKEITRQEMFVMLYNALKVMEELPAMTVEKQLKSFNDTNQIATWANEALSTLVKAGIVSGNNNNLNPTSSTTRAEIAQVLYNLLSK